LGGVVCSRLFGVDFALGWVVLELLGATDLRGGGELQLFVNLIVVNTFFFLYASKVCWGWVNRV